MSLLRQNPFFFRRLGAFAAAALTIFIARPVYASSSATKDAAPPDAIGEALPVLKAGYADYPSLKLTGNEHLADLAARSNGRISLEPVGAATPAPVFTALLPGNVIYWRLASFTPEKSWADLASETEKWSHDGAEGVVLDVRSNAAPGDLAGAAQVTGLFAPAGAPLFKIDNSPGQTSTVINPHAGDPVVEPLVVLTNGETTGAAEALAAYLQKNEGALVMGEKTAGNGAIFTERKLPSGPTLCFASTPIFLADGTEVWGHPVAPDLDLAVNPQTEKNALVLIAQHDVADVVQETSARKRLSEASLVQGEDPELDAYVAAREKMDHVRLSTADAVQDVALIRALDSLKAIRLSQRTVEAPKVETPVPAPSPVPSSVQ
jgi:hypothetical protein